MEVKDILARRKTQDSGRKRAGSVERGAVGGQYLVFSIQGRGGADGWTNASAGWLSFLIYRLGIDAAGVLCYTWGEFKVLFYGLIAER